MTHAPQQSTRWWTEPWWLDEQYAMVYRDSISSERVNACVLAVARIFSEAWLKTTRPHRAAYWLLSRGLDLLQFLISLGKDILATQSVPGVSGLVRNLCNPDNYESARLELSIAALLCEESFGVRLHPRLRNGKSSDLAAQCDEEEVYFEVKILRESDVDELLCDFRDWLGRTVDELAAQDGSTLADKNYLINLEPDMADFFATRSRANPEFHTAFAAESKDKILRHPRAFSSWLRVLFRNDWVVYSKQPFGGPEHVLRYLGAYTHRVAICSVIVLTIGVHADSLIVSASFRLCGV